MNIIVRDLTKLERLNDEAIDAFVKEYRSKINKVAYVSDAIYTVTELCAKNNIDYAEVFVDGHETYKQLIINNSAVDFNESAIYGSIMSGQLYGAQVQLQNMKKAIDNLVSGDYAFILFRNK